jgi:hypothetical protein
MSKGDSRHTHKEKLKCGDAEHEQSDETLTDKAKKHKKLTKSYFFINAMVRLE